jgi:hypothetical protein
MADRCGDLVRRVARLRAGCGPVLRDDRGRTMNRRTILGRVWADELLLAAIGWSLVAAVAVWT